LSDRTEDPTPKRLRKAREDGDVPSSAALTSSVVFLVAGSLIGGAAAALVAWATAALRRNLQPRDPALLIEEALSGLLLLTLPLVAAAAATAVVVSGIQAGGNFSSKKLLPNLEKLSPIQGIRSLVSPTRLFQVARSLLGALLTIALLRSRLRDHLGDLSATLGSPMKAAAVAGLLAKGLLRDVALLLLALALVDVILTHRSYVKKLRMTKDEVKREAKESEGDPQLKSAREQAHHELLSQASLTAVRSATVVVVNPTHVAAALRYRDGEDDAPELVAKGEGAHAQRIIETARAAGVPVVRDIPLARALVELEEGEQIPEALYEATAEVLRAIAETDE
jgi:type III secretion protein U